MLAVDGDGRHLDAGLRPVRVWRVVSVADGGGRVRTGRGRMTAMTSMADRDAATVAGGARAGAGNAGDRSHAVPDARRAVLDQRREICRRRYDEIHAPVYDQRGGSYRNVSHEQCVAELIASTDADAEVLDAGCGTGKYWRQLLDSGRRVFGIDQSAGMLARAAAKAPDVPTRVLALQDLSRVPEFRSRFGGLLCVDVLENVGPEDWPLVLSGFRAVLRDGAAAYLTVELPDGPLPDPPP